MYKNHYGVYVDSEVPTTGVFQNNHVDWLGDDMFGSESYDLGHNEALNELVGEKWREVITAAENPFPLQGTIDCIRDLLDEIENPEIDGLDTSTFLIGFEETKDKEEAWYWFDDLGFGMKPDPNAEYSAIVGEIYTQVVKSKWLLRGALCSPCYPGQVDADTKGEFLSYSFPPDIYEEGNEMRARIFRQEENKMLIDHQIRCPRCGSEYTIAGKDKETFVIDCECGILVIPANAKQAKEVDNGTQD